ncbi:hypothetical protein QL093DRAFT_2594471 [Fusarium oxysporum]|nr:hypothetical protein QL093DRAFT_2594471 [Fusarium oxysporum]
MRKSSTVVERSRFTNPTPPVTGLSVGPPRHLDSTLFVHLHYRHLHRLQTMADGPSSGVAQAPFPKSRGVTACQKCRTRKTRCDNRRPTCGFCLKRRLTCVYPADEDQGSVTGAEILHAIHHLTKIVENQHSPQQSPAQTVESLSSSVRQPTLDNWAVPQNVTIRPQGVESILSWKIFAADRPASCLFAQSTPPSLGNYPVPDTSYPQLAWLEAQYIEALHTKNPIIDLDELHHMMIHVAEHGFDWSTGACLVALVCANAAITDSHTEMSSSPEVTAEKKAEIELSMQFWSVAVKRLGYASAQNTVQAVQCLCLAGIWYMHRLEPLEAWKHFNLAGAAWHTLSLTHGELSGHTEDQGCSNEFTLMQALCFTIWKSECELRLELPLPTPPILDNAYLPLAFPQPPDFGSHPDASDKERSWYYYLSEIAARHVINRLVQMNSEAPEFPNEKHVRRMISQAELMQSQISDWHSSLPPIFHFDTPQGYTADAVADPMVFILRHRYISLCELVSRPFVRLCVDQLADEMDASLHGIITSYASQCVRFCILKLDQVAGHRHQGTWYGIRVATSAALILAAVDRAQRQTKEDESFHLVQSVTLPETWKGAVARGAASKVTPDDVHSDFDVEHVIQNASVSDKISLLSGRDFWHTNPLPAFNVPSVRVSDGPNGVRGTKFVDGVPAACLPCGTGLAATWDQDLLYKAGVLIGNECIAKGAHCWLGPTVCIQRSPLGGRGFESMAEDPYATGKLAAAYIKGVQSTGVVSIIKHWLANDQEHERVGVNVVASERALREVHMLPFQIALSDAAPGGVMACYNKVNGKHVSENRDFLDSLLREEWQWRGLIMSDWCAANPPPPILEPILTFTSCSRFGTYSTTEAINAGLDLEMPGPTRQRGQLLDLAVSTRKVSRSTIDARARNVLEFIQRCTKVPVAVEEGGRDYPEDRQLNRKLAGDSVVLLKNENNQLPLKRPFKSIALIGPNMKTTSFCGGGSAHLRPYYTVSPYEGIVAQLPPDVEVRYEVGASASGWNPLMQGEMMTTPEGSPGMRMRFYSQGPSVPGREIIDESHLPDSSWLLMGYSHPKLDKLFYATVEGDLVIQETGLFEFGLAVYGSARLYVDGQLLIDNNLVQRGGTFFFGKGTVEEKAQKRLVQGQKYRITVEYESAPSSKLVKPGVVNFGGGAGRVGLASAIDPEIGIQNAVSAALQSDVTILCVGMTRDQESEGFDRPHMDLPGSLPRLASAVLAAVPDAIMVTQSGTPFNMLWAESAKTHVHAWLAGNETGNGIADVLFGATCPSGKLPLSFPRRLQDTPTFLNFGSERGRVIYGEDIYVGYRYYEKVDRDVLYPFGHGLSYTTFTYDKLNLASSHVSFEITNSGSVPGAEVSQLYIAADEATSSIQRPKKELKGFKKTYLQPDMANNIESTSRDTLPPTSTMAEKEKHEDSPQPPNDSLDLNVPDDPDMPLNWPKSKRWINIMIVSILTLLTPFASSMIAPAIQPIMDEMHETNPNIGSFMVSIYLLGYAFGPLFLAPLSEIYGRLPVYRICMIVFLLTNIACALSINMPMLIIFRLLTGLAGACPLTIGPASVADCFSQEERGRAMAIWNMPVLLGPSLGPAVGAYVSRGLGWRWNFWLLIIMTGAVLVICAFVQKETHAPTLQRKKLRKLQKECDTADLPVATPHSQLIKRSLARPLKMLFFSPIIFGLSFLTAIAYGTLYLLFTTVSETFKTKYGIVTNVGLIYLGFGCGQIVGLILFGMVSDPILRRMARGGELKPEYRLPLMIPCSAIIPIGLLVYGWTTEYGVFWFVPVIGTFMIGFGMITVFTSVSTYLVDAFPTYAASATAANTVLRSIGGALLPLAGPKMFDAIGQGWGNTLLAGVSLAMISMIVISYRYGERLRTGAKYQLD